MVHTRRQTRAGAVVNRAIRQYVHTPRRGPANLYDNSINRRRYVSSLHWRRLQPYWHYNRELREARQELNVGLANEGLPLPVRRQIFANAPRSRERRTLNLGQHHSDRELYGNSRGNSSSRVPVTYEQFYTRNMMPVTAYTNHDDMYHQLNSYNYYAGFPSHTWT